MSSLLKEAIIDAKALKEAALKNAESTIIDKYSDEVKQMVENILEQDEEPLGGEEGGEPAANAEEVTETEIPLASTNNLSNQEGTGLEKAPSESEEIEFNVDLNALQEAIESLEAELNEEEHDDDKELDEELELSEETIASLLEDEELEEIAKQNPDADAEEAKADAEQMDDLEEQELDADSLVDAIMEKLTVDMGADLAGWAGRSSEDQKYQMEKEDRGQLRRVN